MVDLEQPADVAAAVRESADRAEPLFVLGGGSNVVVGDEGFPGVVARMRLEGIHVRREGPRVVVYVAAGEDWDALVDRAVSEGWSGLECLSGIPGLVGATPIQNVGAYGQEVKETIGEVRVLDRRARAVMTLDASRCRFSYRASAFKGDERFVVVGVTFVLEARLDSAPLRYAELTRALAVEHG